jgi:hypothetical protein
LAAFVALGQRLRNLTDDEKADLFSRARKPTHSVHLSDTM